MKAVQRIIKRVDELMMLFGIWMADVAPWIFKPIKFWWADRMILACGFQDPDGKTVIIYRPALHSREHELCIPQSSRLWKGEYTSLQAKHQAILGNTMYIVRSSEIDIPNCFIMGRGRFKTVRSRMIQRRNLSTAFQQLHLHAQNKNGLIFSWKNPRDKDFWFAFLTLEDDGGNLISGIYTKNDNWKFHEVDDLPYFVHNPAQAKLKPNHSYTATLYAVNRFNWVTHIDTLSFVP